MRSKTFFRRKSTIILCLTFLCCILGASAIFAQSETKTETKLALFSVSSEASTAYYGESPYVEGLNGIVVGLAMGDTFTYNEPIDMSTCTSGVEFFELCITPEKQGEEDFTEFVLTFTDVYDSENAISVKVHQSKDGDGIAYLLAKAGTEQPYSAMEYGVTLHTNDNYGQWAKMSFKGIAKNTSTGDLKNNSFSLAFDYAEKQMRLFKNGPTMVFSDFDDMDYYTTAWNGFTDGKVFLSVTADSYYKSKGNFVIKKIGSLDLTRTEYTDNVKPNIIVDTDSQETVPNAVIGKAYKLFDAYAMDNFDGYIDTSAAVYKNYYSNSKVNVSVVNGSFTPTDERLYCIEYSAIDSFGNKATKVIEVRAVAETPSLTVTFLGGALNTAFVGNKVYFPSYSLSGGTGALSSEVSVKLNGNAIERYDNYFIPVKAGTYVFTVTVTDYVGQSAEFEFDIDVTLSEGAVIFDDVNLLKYYIKGKSYNLPELKACDYNQTPAKELNCKIYEIIGENKKEITSGYTPADKGDVIIRYEADNGIKKTFKDYTASIVETSAGINIKDYFVNDNFDISVSSNEMTFSASEKSTAEFINPVAFYDFNVEFSVDSSYSDYQYINFYLRNFYNDEYVKFTYENIGSGKVKFYINDNKNKSTSCQWMFNGDENTLKVNTLTLTAQPDIYNGIVVSFDGFYSGKKITTDDDKCYFSVELDGIKSNSAINLIRFANQSLSNVGADLISPAIYFSKSPTGDKAINSYFVFSKAVLCDVLDTNATAYMTLLSPSNVAVKDENGTVLNRVAIEKEYLVKFTEYGTYRLLYYAVDASGNESNSYGFVINVPEDVPPVITVQGSIPTTAKVGTAIIIPQITVTDNVSGNVSLAVYVIGADGKVTEIKGSGFIPDKTGTYYVRLVGSDTGGNITVKVFKILVTE